MSNLKYIGKNILNHDLVLKKGNISGSSVSTGSFGYLNVVGDITGSTTSTGSFGSVETVGDITATTGNIKTQNSRKLQAFRTTSQYVELYSDPNGFNYLQPFGGALRFAPNGGTKMILHTNGRLGLNTTTDAGFLLDINGTGRFSDTLEVTSGNISGSATSTGSFGRVESDDLVASSRILGPHGFQIISSGGEADIQTSGDLRLSTNTRLANDGLHLEFGAGNDLKIVHSNSGGTFSGNTNIIEDTTSVGLDFKSGLGFGFNNNITVSGNVSGSATSTGSFGRVEVEHIHSTDDISAADDITAGGRLVAETDAKIANIITLDVNGISVGGDTRYIRVGSDSDFEINHRHPQHTSPFRASTNTNILTDKTNSGLLLFGGTPGIILESAVSASEGMFLSGSRANIELRGGNISGSATSTGSFGNLKIAGMSVSDVTVFSSSLSTRITNDSASISARITADSSSISARITADSSSFAARDTLSETTSSKILNGELEFTNITGSGHISMSMFSTASFGRVEATTIGGHSPLSVDSVTTFNETTNFQNYISMSSAGTLDLKGKILIQTGSILGDLHIKTNEDLMRFGKATSGLVVSGSSIVSRFATGSDGTVVDLGFTIVDEDGDEVVSGDGDGIHVDSNNYWYNNTFYRVGDSNVNYLQYDGKGMRYYGELYAQTGSLDGELYIKSPTGSMFIGKYTGGWNISGSGNMSRFATGSDGSIIDLGFTITDEAGATQVISTGDGLYVDDNSYWYTTGNFKVGDGDKKIDWNKQTLNISASTVDVTTLKASDVNFSNLPTSDPLVTGSLWISGSSSSGSYKSGFVMVSGIHG